MIFLTAPLILIRMAAFAPLPSLAAAVMVTVLPAPAVLAFTTPLDDTEAYRELLLFQVTDGFSALDGATESFSRRLFPVSREDLPDSLRDAAFTGEEGGVRTLPLPVRKAE